MDTVERIKQRKCEFKEWKSIKREKKKEQDIQLSILFGRFSKE